LWISFILLIAIWSIGKGYNKHKVKSVLWLALTGICFLLAGTIFENYLSIWLESIIFVTGGLLLTFAHWKNYKLEGMC